MLNPPFDSRKRVVEKFGFTAVFEENSTQLEIFKGAGVAQMIEGVLMEGRDGLLATLGVTGSGKVCRSCPRRRVFGWLKSGLWLTELLDSYDARVQV